MSAADQQKVLGDLQKLTNDKLIIKNGEVRISKIGGQNNDKKLNTGTALIRDLIKDNNTVTIKIDPQGPAENDINPVAAVRGGNGSDTEVLMNYSNKDASLTKDKNGNLSRTSTPFEIIIGHEMIHAMRSIMELATPYVATTDNTYTDDKGKTKKENISLEEAQTTGLPTPYNNRAPKYNENKIRREQGLGERVSYLE